MAEAKGEEKTTEVQTSKYLVLTGHGGYDKLKIQQKPKPKPEKGEVLVKVKAAGINFSELMARQGTYDRSPKLPCVLGAEASGVVEEIGEEVENVKVGDRVGVLSATNGCWAEFVAVPHEQVFALPDDMSFEDAAAIPINYLTAHMMLYDFGNLRKGKNVLVHMAAGGVGIAVTQLCKCVPDVTVFGTCSPEKHDMVREEGVTHPIDYQDYVTEVKKISPKGVDIVLDPLGGTDAGKGFNLLKPMGKIIHYGAANTMSGPGRSLIKVAKVWWDTKNVNPLNLMAQNKAVCGFHLGHLDKDQDLILQTLQEILDLYNQGKVKPKIDSVWALEDVGKAMAKMHERKNVGKVLLSPEKEPIVEPEEEKKKEKKKDKKEDKKEKKEDKKEVKEEKGENKEENEVKEEKEEAAEEPKQEEQTEEKAEEKKEEEAKPQENQEDGKTEE